MCLIGQSGWKGRGLRSAVCGGGCRLEAGSTRRQRAPMAVVAPSRVLASLLQPLWVWGLSPSPLERTAVGRCYPSPPAARPPLAGLGGWGQ